MATLLRPRTRSLCGRASSRKRLLRAPASCARETRVGPAAGPGERAAANCHGDVAAGGASGPPALLKSVQFATAVGPSQIFLT